MADALEIEINDIIAVEGDLPPDFDVVGLDLLDADLPNGTIVTITITANQLLAALAPKPKPGEDDWDDEEPPKPKKGGIITVATALAVAVLVTALALWALWPSKNTPPPAKQAAVQQKAPAPAPIPAAPRPPTLAERVAAIETALANAVDITEVTAQINTAKTVLEDAIAKKANSSDVAALADRLTKAEQALASTVSEKELADAIKKAKKGMASSSELAEVRTDLNNQGSAFRTRFDGIEKKVADQGTTLTETRAALRKKADRSAVRQAIGSVQVSTKRVIFVAGKRQAEVSSDMSSLDDPEAPASAPATLPN